MTTTKLGALLRSHLYAEDGPEMIMPLARTIEGKLTVKLDTSRRILVNAEVANGYLENRQIADKAVVALAILKEERKPDDVGVGANRDDAPMFKGIADAYVRGEAIPKNVLFQSRHRVRKYARQLRESKFYTGLMDDDVGLEQMVRRYHQGVTARMDHEIMELEVKTVRGYGDW